MRFMQTEKLKEPRWWKVRITPPHHHLIRGPSTFQLWASQRVFGHKGEDRAGSKSLWINIWQWKCSLGPKSVGPDTHTHVSTAQWLSWRLTIPSLKWTRSNFDKHSLFLKPCNWNQSLYKLDGQGDTGFLFPSEIHYWQMAAVKCQDLYFWTDLARCYRWDFWLLVSVD